MTIKVKGNEKHFPVLLFNLPYKVVLTFRSVDKFRTYKHSNEFDRAVLSGDIMFIKLYKVVLTTS